MTEKDEIDLLKIRVDQLDRLDKSTQIMLKEFSEIIDALIDKLGGGS